MPFTSFLASIKKLFRRPARAETRPPRRGIVFLAWGKAHMATLQQCVRESRLPDYPLFLITDETTPVDQLDARIHVIRTRFALHGLKGHAKKCELGQHLPDGFDSMLFLDVDTRVLGDISLGFDKAEQYGIAMAQAAHYSLDHFKNFGRIMVQEGVEPRGQLLYNSGVLFFARTPRVHAVLDLWHRLGEKYAEEPLGDQAYLTLAMELLDFNPYTLTTGYNHRAFGEWISGEVRIWHSYEPVPPDVNELRPAFPRCYWKGQMMNPFKLQAPPAPPA